MVDNQTRTLADALREHTGVHPAQQLALYDGLALLRDAVGPALIRAARR